VPEVVFVKAEAGNFVPHRVFS